MRTHSCHVDAIVPRAGTAAALALSLMLGTGAALAAAPLFDAPMSFPTGADPSHGAVGDVNGDGKPDLVVAVGDFDNHLSVMLGNGDGTLGPQIPIGLPWGYTAIRDLNADGKPDLAITAGSEVEVLLGHGDGTFGPGAFFPCGSGSVAITTSDLNEDGKPDVLTSNWDSDHSIGSVSVLLGNGDGTFQPHADYGTPANPVALAVGDLNGDGKPDLAVANSLGGSLSVFLGAGDGTFGTRTDYAVGGRADNVAIADLNGDSRPDLVGVSSSFTVLFGNGDGSFTSSAAFGSGIRNAGTAADVNGDGRTDLIGSCNGGMAVLLGNGDGTFGPQQVFRVPGDTNRQVFGDLSGDGLMDVIVLQWGCTDIYDMQIPPGMVYVVLGNRAGTLKTVKGYPTGGSPNAIVLADVNRDGNPDLIVPNSGAGTLSVLPGLGDGSFGAGAATPVGAYPLSVAMGDIDGDGYLDAAVADSSSMFVSVLFGASDGSLGSRTDIATNSPPRAVALGDLNGDGKSDLAIGMPGNPWSTSQLAVILGDAGRTLTLRADLIVPGAVNWLEIRDVTRDGNPDLVMLRYTNPGSLYEGWTSVLPGNGDGTFGTIITSRTGYRPKDGSLGDFNGDGFVDIANLDAGQWSYKPWMIPVVANVELGNGDGTFLPGPVNILEDTSPPEIADLDGDGRADLVVPGGCGGLISTFLGHGGSTLGPRFDYAPGGAGHTAAGDLNRDGKMDLVTADRAGNTVLVLLDTSPDVPTPALLSLFVADWTSGGIELRWQFGDPSRWAAVVLQRSAGASGPWVAVSGAPQESGGAMRLLDTSAEAGRTWYYRLLATASDGVSTTFGPLAVNGGASVREFELAPVVPNPGQDRVRIEFAVPFETHVRLSVLDVQGRRVAQLEDGVLTPGRYQALWDGATERGRAPTGVYFARLEAAGQGWVRRFSVVR